MHRRLQFDKRENPASDRRYGSRSAVTMEPPPNAVGKDRSSTTTAGTIIDDAPIESHISPHAAANRAATGEKRTDDQLLTVDEVATRYRSAATGFTTMLTRLEAIVSESICGSHGLESWSDQDDENHAECTL